VVTPHKSTGYSPKWGMVTPLPGLVSRLKSQGDLFQGNAKAGGFCVMSRGGEMERGLKWADFPTG